MKILITTQNKLKCEAIETTFNTFCKAHPSILSNESVIPVAEVQPFNCNYAGVDHGQPFGHQQTFECARFRINRLKEMVEREGLEAGKDYEFIVSVENGVFTILDVDQSHSHDVACVIVENKDGVTTHAFSFGRPFPLDGVQRKRREGVPGGEIGKFVAEYYGGVYGEEYTRTHQIQEAASIALLEMCRVLGQGNKG
eukprot:GFYU01002188.1.p1 GENE.GFYU01002188.1~~GFYU01002188.1.p1  ORF type:complete len:197 (-),score=13.06 GFYU01002188.1:46-636(-)